jgi:hypothetical protein
MAREDSREYHTPDEGSQEKKQGGGTGRGSKLAPV